MRPDYFFDKLKAGFDFQKFFQDSPRSFKEAIRERLALYPIGYSKHKTVA